MNAPETGADGTNATDAGAARNSPDQARLRRLADQQAALRRVATLVAGGARPAEVFTAISLHSPRGGGTAVSCELPVPADGGQPDAGHDQ